jgi:cytochrome c556
MPNRQARPIRSQACTAPVNDPEWQKYVEGLRAAGLAAYQAAQTKNMDKMLDASDQVGTACLNCHDRYRQRTRCE